MKALFTWHVCIVLAVYLLMMAIDFWSTWLTYAKLVALPAEHCRQMLDSLNRTLEKSLPLKEH